MKRDMDLCRRILLEVEKWPTTLEPKGVEIEGYSPDEVSYHSWLLGEEGLIEGCDFTTDGSDVQQFAPTCLTYRGHDFLEHARDDTRWKKAKDKLVSVGGGMTTQTLQYVLNQLLAGQLNF